MVFNWFRRKFDDEQEKNTVTPDEKPVEKVDTPAVPAQDLLNWAKTAYANIQARENNENTSNTLATESLSESTEVSPPESLSVQISEPEVLELTETALSETPIETIVDNVDPQVVNDRSESSEGISEISEVEVIKAIEVKEPESLPFWADSDRQARIAALNANVIEEPVDVTESIAIASSIPELPVDQGLDEGFLWSAEILAAQGRRPQDVSVEEIAWLKRLRQGLDKTRLSLVNQLKALVGKGPLNADAVDEIEALLLQADVGVKATDLIIQKLQAKIRDEVLPPEAAIAFLKQILQEILEQPFQNTRTPVRLAPEQNQLNVWLITGVNGAGKTTTIGKLAHLSKNSGYSTLIAAADTFRAAAVQQVQVWGDRSGVEVIANIGKNTDPASVVFDAIVSAQSRGTELLLVDTAGRLQNKQNLMDELSKIRRIVDKKATGAKVESLLVLDATLGQNGLRQAEVFTKSAGISGVILTKLDGTARGGVAIAVVQQLGLPIRFIGAGEGINDLRPFSSYEFVEALLSS
ncbi:signal recognition particle-docking protein FtsY [Synechococcus sp. PCC 7502]|uniref:signal recognition particle-docking protein FtsY n=1 Tax=Synechococcus sp. PCC 7502 TaxID=1173263 RepID=UPI00029F9846|nr:signal recognition particle-docking protein FtsY [Synechococcus sp. PCC 7502]AFY73617.1 signal recognition particle-docking protein FtsY [Synechococcus sp. PCC 7502]